jgi:tRNA nucleotidyltransferase (CCA-adding enzyme)
MIELLNRHEKKILQRLDEAGYEGYFVGGCVRDALMMGLGMEVVGIGDVDITTSALPHETKEVFGDMRTIDTGIKHGTVTVLLDGSPVEITTYRTDGEYSDSRHPDSVCFVRNLEEDLARRDFTMNAMGCNLHGDVVDPFGGLEDIKCCVIRAVGDPQRRFEEDALRIMRGLRFAAVLGFEIDSATEAAMFACKDLLTEISVERIFVEFRKLVCGRAAGHVVRKYVDILGVVMPELAAMKGFLQHNSYHKYDVLEHCIRAMEVIRTTEENKEYMKIAALFHDIGKPETFSMDDEGIGHFYGHPSKGEEVVTGLLKRLKVERAMSERIQILVKRHDLIFDTDEKLLKRWMNRLGPDVLAEILEIKLADNIGTGNMSEDLGDKFCEIREMIAAILASEDCFCLKDLAVNGRDLMGAGIAAGPELGEILQLLLEKVIDGEVANEREALIEAVSQIYD